MNTAQTIAAAGFDISILAGDAPVELATFPVNLIFDKDGNPVSGLICVGKNSTQYRAEKNAIRASNIMRGANTGTSIDTKTEDGAMQMVELTDANQERLALAVVVDWFGFTNAGAQVPFDKKLVAAGFKKFPTWIDEVHVGLEKEANFMKLLSANSSNSPTNS